MTVSAFLAAWVAAASVACAPAGTVPTPAQPFTVVSFKTVWKADAYCRAHGAVRPRGTRISGCFLIHRNEVVESTDAPEAYRAAQLRHEAWHAAGWTHPDSGNGCSTWVKPAKETFGR